MSSHKVAGGLTTMTHLIDSESRDFLNTALSRVHALL